MITSPYVKNLMTGNSALNKSTPPAPLGTPATAPTPAGGQPNTAPSGVAPAPLSGTGFQNPGPIGTIPPGNIVPLGNNDLQPVTIPGGGDFYAPPPANAQPPATGGIPTTPFGPGNDLIGSQIAPSADPRLTTTQGQVDTAAANLATGPDRSALAQDYWNQFAQSTAPQYGQDLREATQLAAANGRLGSGMLTNRYGDVATQRAQQLDLAQRGFMTDALAGTIQDRLNNVGALSGLENQQFGQGSAARNELRGERGYQYGLSQDATQSGVQQQLLQEQLLNGQSNRDNTSINTLGNLGFQNNPGAVYLGASGDVGAQAAQTGQNTGDLLYQYLLNQQTQPQKGYAPGGITG